MRCLQIVEKAIVDAGGKRENVIRTRIFLKDISQWQEAARAHGEFLGDIRPACTFVGINALINEEWLLEMEADCVIE